MFRVASEPEFRQVPVENVDDSSPVDFDEEGEDDASSDAALDVAVPVSFGSRSPRGGGLLGLRLSGGRAAGVGDDAPPPRLPY